MADEIERKFLLPGVPAEAAAAPSDAIDQGYLAVDDEAEVRVRRIAERHVLTVKRGAGLRRLEEETELTAAQFAALWPATEGRRVQKRRHRVQDGGLTIEVDVYAGAHEGLVVAEIEFADEAASAAYAAPAWLGREITGDRRYANQQLALAGRPPA